MCGKIKYVSLLFLLFSFSMLAVSHSAAKTIKREFCVLKGDTRTVSIDSTRVKKLKVGNKKISVKVRDFSIRVRGKKIGKSKFSYRIPGMKHTYKYKVIIYSKKKVRKKANRALKKYLAKLPEGTRYAYADFNKDGIKELLHEGKITFYNYQIKKCKTRKYGFEDIYVSPETKVVFATYRKPKETRSFIYYSSFYRPSASKIFALNKTGTGYKKYTETGKKKFLAKAPYAYYDESDEQDDYNYEAMTESEIWQAIEKKMPGYKKVMFKIKTAA